MDDFYQPSLLEEPASPPLMFVARCDRCGGSTEPIPAEGDGNTWKSAEAWAFIAIDQHRQQCTTKA